MRKRRAAAVIPKALALACVLAVAPPARADTTVRGFATAGVGVSDNATFQVDGSGTQRVTALTFELRPGVAMAVREKRDTHLFGYALRLSLVAADAATQTYTNQVLWRWIHEAGPRDHVALEVVASQGRNGPFYLVATSGGPLVGAPAEVSRFATVGAKETWTRQLSPVVNGIQQLGVSTYVPLDSNAALAQSWDFNALVGVERAFVLDALRFDLGADYVLYRAVTVPNAVRPEGRQILASAVGRWRHQLSLDLQTELAAGAIGVASADALGSPVIGPTASASLRRVLSDGTLAATVSHSTASNLYLGLTQTVDEASLNAILPVDRRHRFRLLGTTAYGHGRNVTGAGFAPVVGAYHYYRVEAGLLHIISKGFRTGLRVQRLDQRADAGAANAAAPTFVSDSVFLEFTAVLPEPEVAAGPPFLSSDRGG